MKNKVALGLNTLVIKPNKKELAELIGKNIAKKII